MRDLYDAGCVSSNRTNAGIKVSIRTCGFVADIYVQYTIPRCRQGLNRHPLSKKERKNIYIYNSTHLSTPDDSSSYTK